MIDFILLLIIGSLFIWGVFAIFDEGNLLGFIRSDAEKDGAVFWLKPLISCPYCMGSVHGAIIGLSFYGLSWLVLPYMICLCGLNFIIKEYLYP